MAINETAIDKKLKKVDNTSPMVGGTFVLYQCAIVSPSNPDNPVDFNSKWVFQELNIFEDLFSNVLRWTFTFKDNQGVTNEMIADLMLEIWNNLSKVKQAYYINKSNVILILWNIG